MGEGAGRMRVVTVGRGAKMRRRGDGKEDRFRHDCRVLALPTTCPGGEPGWSFKRGGDEYWYVLAEDATPLEGD